MDRRLFVRTLGVTGATALAGCTGGLFGSGGEDVDPKEEEFRYFLDDQTGTLGSAADDSVPEDAAEWQVVENTLEEDDWAEKQENDLQKARGFLQGTLERYPNKGAHEGSVEEIIARTEEIYNNPGTVDNELMREKLESDDDPVRFTRSLVRATDEVTDVTTSGGKDFIVPNIAESAAEEVGLETNVYNLNSTIAAEPLEHLEEDQLFEGSIRERENGNTVGIKMTHLISTLEYEKDGELHTKYVENTGALPSRRFRSAIGDPEERLYRMPIEEGPFELNRETMWPEHYVTAFDTSKMEEMVEIGVIPERLENLPSKAIGGMLFDRVDDGINDLNYLPNGGIKTRFSDQIKDQVEDYILNPTVEKKRRLDSLARATYLVAEKVIGEKERDGEPYYASLDPIRVEGSLENPEFYHEPRNK